MKSSGPKTKRPAGASRTVHGKLGTKSVSRSKSGGLKTSSRALMGAKQPRSR